MMEPTESTFLRPFPVTVSCPIEGLEAVQVTYNMACSNAELLEFQRSLGEKWENVIVGVDGWPEELGEPFSDASPIVFRIWACRHGYTAAMRDLVTDPKLATG